MTTLLVGFDSAWTPTNVGAIVGVLRYADGSCRELGPPQAASFPDAERQIRRWQTDLVPDRTVVLLDQPTLVPNSTGQRPVEHVVASPVSRRLGGVQPASRSRVSMFGPAAPVWGFLAGFDELQDPWDRARTTRVLETFPVLALIALGWTLPHDRPAGRLPKYNPARCATFSLADWRHVCRRAADALAHRGLSALGAWLEDAGRTAAPRKQLQDGVDACICLIVALQLADGGGGLLIGDRSGYMVVPHHDMLRGELEARCRDTERSPSDWVRAFSL